MTFCEVHLHRSTCFENAVPRTSDAMSILRRRWYSATNLVRTATARWITSYTHRIFAKREVYAQYEQIFNSLDLSRMIIQRNKETIRQGNPFVSGFAQPPKRVAPSWQARSKCQTKLLNAANTDSRSSVNFVDRLEVEGSP